MCYHKGYLKAEFDLTGLIRFSLSHDSPDLVPVTLLEFESLVDLLCTSVFFFQGFITQLTSLISVNQFLKGQNPPAAEGDEDCDVPELSDKVLTAPDGSPEKPPLPA